MCTITLGCDGTDTPESHCDNCDMRFSLVWQRTPLYDRPEYCPFCGDEIEDVVTEGLDDE